LKNIRTQNGCWNCKFRLEEHDLSNYHVDWPNWFCNYDKVCPSTYKDWEYKDEDGSEFAKYDEKFNTINEDAVMERYEKMSTWRREHKVEPYQVCDNWEKP
jgi:hypothetical protein